MHNSMDAISAKLFKERSGSTTASHSEAFNVLNGWLNDIKADPMTASKSEINKTGKYKPQLSREESITIMKPKGKDAEITTSMKDNDKVIKVFLKAILLRKTLFPKTLSGQFYVEAY